MKDNLVVSQRLLDKQEICQHYSVFSEIFIAND